MPAPKTQLLLIALLATMVSLAQADDQVSFNRQIRPILTDICFNCHGPDAATNEGGVRLDSFEAATKDGDSGEPIIVPGASSKSELVKRLFDKDDPMPPADFEKQLSNPQKALIKTWIDQGAKYEGHWAFTAPTRPKLPAVKNRTWPRNPVDHFILAKLEANNLQPTREAEKTTLIRRLALDLTGLPPTIAEVDEFLADQSDEAYERIVDQYLNSPNFGERMAIPWLDVARYADSNGFQSDGSRNVWAWRDWVINAYNRNLPFDEFTIQQIAGDMLPNPTRAQIIATGFNRNHRLNGEGGRIVDEWFVETVIDRVETTGLTWLGLTFNCCRCHDHKFDPISQKEFYQMFAFFNSNEESGVLAPAGNNGANTPPLLKLTTPKTDAKVAQYNKLIADWVAKSKKTKSKENELIAQWESTLDIDTSAKSIWSIAELGKIGSSKGVKFKKQSDNSYLVSGKNPAKPIYDIELPIEDGKLTGLMIEAIQDDSLPKKFLGRTDVNGNFVLTDVVLEIPTVEVSKDKNASESASKMTQVKFKRAEADFEQPGWTAFSVLQPKSKVANGNKGWATIGFKATPGAANRIMFVTANPVEVEPGTIAKLKLFFQSPHANHAIGRFRIQTTDADPDSVELGDTSIPTNILEILAVENSSRSKEQNSTLKKFYLTSVPNPIQEANKKAQNVRDQLKRFQASLPTTMVMKESKKRDAFILERGEYDQKRDKVERGLPAFLPPMTEGQPMDRLGLANWIVDPKNPLTPRVWVNRTWAMFFGTGLVKTTENFGTMADFPSHPELLDWLAVEFVQPQHLPKVNGTPATQWDMKAFIKMLVMSSAYRQSSEVTPKLLKTDPENRLLSRGPRFRLTGELIRDQALAVSGLLVNKIGGPSVRPYMPEKVWDETSVYGDLRNYKHDTGEGLYRRSIYTIWKRTAAPPSMLLFDAPNREICTVNRSKTNTPLQALSLLNEITFVEAAQGLAKRMIDHQAKTAKEKIAFGFKAVTLREPNETELNVLLDGFNEDLEKFKDDSKSAEAFLDSVKPGNAKTISPENRASYAAFGLTANVLLNLDEFVSRD